MTAIQICALITLIAFAGLLIWAGYKMGHIDGKSAGLKERDEIQRAESVKPIRELQAKLDFFQPDHQRLVQRCKQQDKDPRLGELERPTLLEIAEKLRIAAETFAALRTRKKKLERETRALRQLALAMACSLHAASEGEAA